MATEGHSFMFGGTKKRSTLVEEKIIQYFFINFSFPREDADAPRQKVLRDFCPSQYDKFREVKYLFLAQCLSANNYDENKCPTEKKILTKCANKAFRNINNDGNYVF